MLASRKRGTRFFVQVVDGEENRALTTIPCESPDEGAIIAERLWKQFA